jgi:NADPH-dependent curcumin reductase CurA
MVAEGIDKTVGAFIRLFQGQNMGKMVVELA